MSPTLAHPKRIDAFDLARGLAVLFMAAVHALQTYATPATYDSVFGWTLEFLGGPPAAPTFMFLMGAVMAFSQRTSVSAMLRRGVGLLALGYLLNALRGSLPVWIAIQAGTAASELGGATPLSEFLQVDILQFAGMAYLILAVVRRFIRNPWGWIGLAVAVAVGSPWLWGRMSGWPALDAVLSLLWGTGGESIAFPVFPWLTFPLVGMAVGRWLATAKDQKSVFRNLALAGVGLLIAGSAITLTNIDFHLGDYWRTGPGGTIVYTGFVMIWVAACSLVAARVLQSQPGKVLAFWSRNVTVFYFIHWVLIGWSVLLVGYESYGVLGTLIGLIIIVLVTDALTRAWNRFVRRRRHQTIS